MSIRGPIAIIAAGELFGGVERHVADLGGFLLARGLQPRVFVFHDRELAARCRSRGLSVSVVPAGGSFDPEGPRCLDRELTAADVHLVHVHGYRSAVNAALAPTVRPLVCTFHGQGEPSWRVPAAFLKDQIYRTAEAWACRRRRAVVCFVTEDLRRRHAHRYRRLDVRTVHNGIEPIDRAAIPAPQPPLAPDRFHALCVGRLTRVKGLEFAIEALSLLPHAHPWHLDIVGDGRLRADLEGLAQRLGVAGRITWHGFRRDVAALMAAADALVMPSLHEGLPYALLEAMSLGLPVVASRVGGLAEVLRNEQTALLVPPADPGAIAAAVARLGNDADLRRAVGDGGAREQRLRYTLETMGEQYLRAYRHAGAR